jgi:hypothetical protein
MFFPACALNEVDLVVIDANCNPLGLVRAHYSGDGPVDVWNSAGTYLGECETYGEAVAVLTNLQPSIPLRPQVYTASLS